MNPIAFSTLACPHWQIETIIVKASEYGYDGIEWRGGPQGHLQPGMPPAQKSLLQKMSMDTGLIAVAVTAYTSFVSDSSAERQSNIDELKRYVDLAAEVDAPFVRAFLGELPEGSSPNPAMYEEISASLNIASDYALSAGVKIAIEPHDDFVRSSAIVPILYQVQHPALRVIWDIGNAFAAGEDPKESLEILKNRLAYVQVKDGRGRHPGWRLCPLGEGDVPLGQALTLLVAKGFQGALSIEWEYAWHPELDPPEVALPAGRRTVKELLAGAEKESA